MSVWRLLKQWSTGPAWSSRLVSHRPRTPCLLYTGSLHGRTQPTIARGQSEVQKGTPADDDDLASEKGHLLAKRALFLTITGGGGSCPLPPPPLGTTLV